MDEAAECLRPGGVYLTVEGDMNVHDESGDLVPELNEGDPVRRRVVSCRQTGGRRSLTMSPLRKTSACCRLAIFLRGSPGLCGWSTPSVRLCG